MHESNGDVNVATSGRQALLIGPRPAEPPDARSVLGPPCSPVSTIWRQPIPNWPNKPMGGTPPRSAGDPARGFRGSAHSGTGGKLRPTIEAMARVVPSVRGGRSLLDSTISQPPIPGSHRKLTGGARPR